MCEVFISADPQSYDSRTRSVRLHGVVTLSLIHIWFNAISNCWARCSA